MILPIYKWWMVIVAIQLCKTKIYAEISKDVMEK